MTDARAQGSWQAYRELVEPPSAKEMWNRAFSRCRPRHRRTALVCATAAAAAPPRRPRRRVRARAPGRLQLPSVPAQPGKPWAPGPSLHPSNAFNRTPTHPGVVASSKLESHMADLTKQLEDVRRVAEDATAREAELRRGRALGVCAVLCAGRMFRRQPRQGFPCTCCCPAAAPAVDVRCA